MYCQTIRTKPGDKNLQITDANDYLDIEKNDGNYPPKNLFHWTYLPNLE